MHGDFFLIEREGLPLERVERLAFGETSGRNEAWLRDTLFAHPEILPIRDIDPSFGPLVPLCRELRTEAGPLDIAFVNPFGRLTLVECKLWRNPEARRRVVAQVLDYARAISRWTYSDLQRQVAAATGRKGNTPYELIKENHPELTEQQFVDATSMAMRRGRFLLLIAGDGIREDVNALAELINRNATMGFAFGLVEVALYGLSDGGLAVQPRAIARTRIVERTIVVAREDSQLRIYAPEDVEKFDPGIGAGENTVVEANELGESPKQAEYRRWWAPVLEMRFDDPDQESPKLYWPNHVRTPLPWADSWVSAYSYGGVTGTLGVGTGGRAGADQLLINALRPHHIEIMSALPQGTEFRKNYKGTSDCYVTNRAYSDFGNDVERTNWIKQTLNQYVNVLRPLNHRIESR